MRLFKYILLFVNLLFAYDYSNINPLLEASVATSSSNSANSASIYINRAYNFKLYLPKGVFKKEPKKEDSNFALFESLDNEATLLIAFKKDSRSLKQIYRSIIDNLKNRASIKFGFHKFFGKWYVVSILDKDTSLISYQKGYKKNGVHIFYILTYPKDKIAKYDPIIKKLNRNFGYTSVKKKKRRKQNSISDIKGGPWCDSAYRNCSYECFDRADEDRCLNICDKKRLRCYKTGKFR